MDAAIKHKPEVTQSLLYLNGVSVTFDGFRPTQISVVVHRVTATNLSIKIGEPRKRPPTLEPPVRSSPPA